MSEVPLGTKITNIIKYKIRAFGFFFLSTFFFQGCSLLNFGRLRVEAWQSPFFDKSQVCDFNFPLSAMAGPAVWRLDPFLGLFADHFVGGTELEGGVIRNAIIVLRHLLEKIVGDAEFCQRWLPDFTPANLEAIRALFPALQMGLMLSRAEPEKPEELEELVNDLLTRISALDPRDVLFVPGGWRSLKTQSFIMHIIFRTGVETYSFVTCNTGDGSQYHPSQPAEGKLRVQASIRIDNIPAARMNDKVFWSMFLTQWMQKPSEYHRSEAVYDVLLPWLADSLLPTAIRTPDPHASWETPQHSSSSAVRSTWEAISYVLCTQGVSRPALKHLTLALRRAAMTKAANDLRVLVDPVGALRAGLVLGFAPLQAPLPLDAPVLEALGNGVLVDRAGMRLSARDYLDGTVALYFSAHWCPPCRAFTPRLIECYNALKARGLTGFEVVFVSGDKSEAEFDEYYGLMPWLALPFADQAVRAGLSNMFQVKGIPTLVIIHNRSVITLDGVECVSEDPEGLAFPWTHEARAEAAARARKPLDALDGTLLRLACDNMALHTTRAAGRGKLGDALVKEIHDELFAIENACLGYPGGETFDRDAALLPQLQPAVRMDMAAPHEPLRNFECVTAADNDAKYVGAQAEVKKPTLANFLEVTEVVTSIEEALAALQQVLRLSRQLLDRAGDGSTPSRISLQHQVIQLIGHLFTAVLPMPLEACVPNATQHPTCIYRTSIARAMQIQLVDTLYQIMLTYGHVWQAIEMPPRAADSERAVVVAAILAVFDASIRRPAADAPAIMAEMLASNGGYWLSTQLCQAHRTLESATRTAELINPALAEVRCKVLEYFEAVQRGCRNPVFDFRMPEKIEIKKFSSTMQFVRTLLERLGIPLFPQRGGRPVSEMEALVEWLIGNQTVLAEKHPEFGMTRDMVVLYKFLATMEGRDNELMRKRKTAHEYAPWHLSFEESGRRGWRSLRPQPLAWEAINFRGADNDIADLDIVGFSDRHLTFADGPLVHSPADLSAMLSIQLPSEDDVLHAPKLPNFSSTLSREEAESLLSFLTVDYVRIPLVLGFFATSDHITYLFNRDLQELLHAAVFDAGPWVQPGRQAAVVHVPARETAVLQREANQQRALHANLPAAQQVLGTTSGLLLNELHRSPGACMEPLLRMLVCAAPLLNCGVYSPEAPFVAFLIGLAVDIQHYLVLAIASVEDAARAPGATPQRTSSGELAGPLLTRYRDALSTVLRGSFRDTLKSWIAEADGGNDTVSACVAHAYLALLWSNASPSEFTPEAVTEIVGSLTFVRNWHGFGLGQLRSQIEFAMKNDIPPEERLLRFMQAHGIDTSRVAPASLGKYLTGRPVFLSIGRETVRVPTLAMPKDMAARKLPPADLPEHRLFAMLQRIRRPLVAWVDAAVEAGTAASMLRDAVRIGLRSPSFECPRWAREGPGRYVATGFDLQLDLQSAEILWRNDDLRPVPDSMTQFQDYQSLFHGEAHHCGLVSRRAHRHWVHVVGTEYDLVEWDEPSPGDLGVGTPTAAPVAPPPARLAAAQKLVKSLGQPLERCLEALQNANDDSNAAANFLLAGTTGVSVSGPPNPGDDDDEDDGPGFARGIPGGMHGRARRRVQAVSFADACVYQGTTYDRALDIYEASPLKGLPPSERWIAKEMVPLLLQLFPENNPKKKLSYKLLLPREPHGPDATECRALGCLDADQEEATWKEFVFLRARNLLLLFNLVSHGRHTYRVLAFVSDSRFSFHDLPLTSLTSVVTIPALAFQAGSVTSRRVHEPTLVVLRRNTSLGGQERFVPKALLAGIVPAALLDNYRYWRGEDGRLRTEVMDASSQWFGSPLELHFAADGRAVIRKHAPGVLCSPIAGAAEPISQATMLLRQHSTAPDRATERRVDEGAAMSLMHLGYSFEAASLALRKTAHNVVRAAHWLCDDKNREEIAALDAASAPTAEAGPAVSEVQALIEKGFSAAASEYAMAMFGQVDAAIAWLSNEHNVAKVAEIERTSGGDGGLARTLSLQRSVSVHGEAEGDLVLFDLLYAPAGSVLFRLASVLSRVEDLSHILVWTTAYTSAASDLTQISLIELPRLKLRLQPHRSPTGAVRLHVADRAGWYVSDLSDTHPARDLLDQLIGTLPHSLILENDGGSLMVLLPNHDVYRPVVAGAPFSRTLVCDRASVGWQEVMESRFYLYPVHRSLATLFCQTLASTLYLILVRLMLREYATAFRLLDTIAVDTTFTAEEEWIFNQIIRTLDDYHPDACACRLKLVLAVVYSPNRPKWDVHSQVDLYIAKRSHVSATCLLTDAEELLCIHQCKQVTPLIKIRLAYLEAVHGRGGLAKAGPTATATLKSEGLRIGGHPWVKFQQLGLDYLNHNSTRLERIQYARPPRADSALLLKAIWEDEVVMDEVSGANKKLGFAFLLDVALGTIPATFGDQEVNDSFAQLMIRYFHLKHARWGRETVTEGETEAVPSRAIAYLAAVLQNPTGPWMQLPTSPAVSRALASGASLVRRREIEQMYGGFMHTHGLGMSSEELISWLEAFELIFRSWMSGQHWRDLVERMHNEVHRVPRAVTVTVPAVARTDTRQPVASNTACGEVAVGSLALEDGTVVLTPDDVKHFSTNPLSCLPLDACLALAPRVSQPRDHLPFDLSSHPAAAPAIASDMLARLAEDVAGFAAQQNTTQIPTMRLALQPGSAAADLALVDDLVAALQALQASEEAVAIALMRRALGMLNTIAVPDGPDAHPRRLARLLRMAGRRARLDADFLMTSLLSTSALEDIHAHNPYFDAPAPLRALAVAAALRISRSSQACRALLQAQALVALLRQFHKDETSAALRQRVTQSAALLAETLTGRRHYADASTGNEIVMDPRFLLAEYVFDLLLRERQVCIVREMVASVRRGDSRVQQMIMGAGKTTVVGPLLTLILADSDSLILQVMPSALLDQSRNILRNRFNAIIRKRVYTLSFDRSCEDYELVAELYEKLQVARRGRHVVCATPESIKSLLLKFMEELERIEACDLDELLPNSSARDTKEIRRLHDQLCSRSQIADGACRILDFVHRSGLLIMDEVDVILNPLRSELNFPIGAAESLAGYRWDLPIYLIDAIFYVERGELCEPLFQSKADDQFPPMEVLSKICAAVERGYASCALQREPHLVLLSESFYVNELRPLVAAWLVRWLVHTFEAEETAVDRAAMLDYLQLGPAVSAATRAALASLSAESRRLLNLASDWTRTILPHCLSKINRVAYGMLTPADLAAVDPLTPESRKLLAVPFIGKDVPSRSSEFAHPDVLMGLAVFAYRYEGMRASDVYRLVSQLKADLARQVGPRDKRPASAIFQSWLEAAAASARPSSPGPTRSRPVTVLPLPLFQPGDPVQLSTLHNMVRRVPSVIMYYLRQHVFPSTMRTQSLKVSACGVDLGSSLLFGRARLGFSGTPNNLTPTELGRCIYEPGSDGLVVHVLTSPEVTSCVRKTNWSARSLLRDVATSDPPVHALIDTGALITGFDNESAARFLLSHLPPYFQGVVYLDRADRQMILLRPGSQSLPLAECGIPPERRFTFYDQVHTTGMDIAQSPNARAVLTIGKDMTFRDYAQGAFRMRGIGRGQTIVLYLISEVDELIRHELPALSQKPELDVPAWLLVNSMKSAALQYCKLASQELTNVWRRRAVRVLTDESLAGSGKGLEPAARVRRFYASEAAWLRQCVNQCREPLGHPLPDELAVQRSFGSKLRELVEANTQFVSGSNDAAIIDNVLAQVEQVAGSVQVRADGLDEECVRENEVQTEAQAEEEAAQEEQRMSMFARDDEQPNPWPADLLAKVPNLAQRGDQPFYRFAEFHTRKDQPHLTFPPTLLLSDNFFKPRWVGVGMRRLKTAELALEWMPAAGPLAIKALVAQVFVGLARQGVPANVAAGQALMKARDMLASGAVDPVEITTPDHFFVALSLSEAETVRRLIHVGHACLASAGVRLVRIDGSVLDQSQTMRAVQVSGAAAYQQAHLLALRFYNNDMFYTDAETERLDTLLSHSAVPDRVAFFEECLRLRRRERNRWGDTPVAKVLTERERWSALPLLAKLDQFNYALEARPSLDLAAMFEQLKSDGRGRVLPSALQRALEGLHLGFAPRDIAQLIGMAAPAGAEIPWDKFSALFPAARRRPATKMAVVQDEAGQAMWQCQACTFINMPHDRACAICGLGWSGEREVPPGQWMCTGPGGEGGCTLFNPNNLFYCDACGRCRSDLSAVRF
eukprot:m.23852 g.23852  ORF g.23852 m.23852 type:complete len:4219 (+) comp8583_c1_seq1:2019-14675(+)